MSVMTARAIAGRERRAAREGMDRRAYRQAVAIEARAQKHGLSVATIDVLYRFQHGRCAICSVPLPIGDLRMDHDHATGERRGLICSWCNRAIALIENQGKAPRDVDEQWIARATTYLDEPPLRQAQA